MPRRRLALCGYQPSPAEKAAFLAGGLPFSVPGAPPVRPARAEKRARRPKRAPAIWGKLRRKRPGSPPGPGRAFCVRRGQNCPPKPDVFLRQHAQTRCFLRPNAEGPGAFFLFGRARRGAYFVTACGAPAAQKGGRVKHRNKHRAHEQGPHGNLAIPITSHQIKNHARAYRGKRRRDCV